MRKVDLNGEWTLAQVGRSKEIKGTVPGCVHADLIAAGEIDDPYYRDNEDHLQWIGEVDWVYSRSFEVSSEIVECDTVLLDCEGLDTFAEIRLNGVEIAKTDNMFRHWKVDTKNALKAGTNDISIIFRSTYPYIKQKQEEHPLHCVGRGETTVDGSNWVRKEQCNYGWDWGPILVTCGIWRSISVQAWSHAKIGDLKIEQSHIDDGKVRMLSKVGVTDFDAGSPATLECTLSYNGDVLNTNAVRVDGDELEVDFVVDQPQLWWPAGTGAQPLYDIEVKLLSSDGECLDSQRKRIGIRRLELIRETDEWGESFVFRANGRDFFAKGANWIPADTFDARVTSEQLRDLLVSAVDANMNCIRVWGGGLYERDEFYDLCDELGLVVWQDFMFACSAYPAHEKSFLENVRQEAIDNVKRLRHHASIILWCGNNELEQIDPVIGDGERQMRWHHYSELFDKLLKEVVDSCDGERTYWPSSEHSPVGNRVGYDEDGKKCSQDPRWGDAHLWDVWHGREPFEWYRGSYHRFCSEFGFQSFPHPATVESYTKESDRNITSYVMERHQRSPIGNSAIINYMLDWFRLPVGYENTVWLSQILQGFAIKYAVEHWRRNMPRCMGAVYWQLNDCWPVASWASIDSHYRWKALHYAARKFFAPVLISGVEKPESKSVEIHLTSDEVEQQELRVEAYWCCMNGDVELVYKETERTPRNGSRRVTDLDLSAVLERDGPRGGLLYLKALSGEEVITDNLVYFAKPKHLDFGKPEITTELSSNDAGDSILTVSTDKPSFCVWLGIEGDPDVRWSDNFFPLMPGHPVVVRMGESSKVEDLKTAIVVKDLTDTH
ncbi:beta-mannosidase [Pelagicoccus mobilis]|uniref:Beta-mannosidase B n=1 Tax=Pelagicoccus mobilis TaxID=415221 RepID=A0A934S4Z3_9BACT|nr:glycoside hydrolase family 2 protein [Pelagicoccus mobilis]MBK1879078.1 glycoside hydrolase family 2 protein [Pelagicoccus mobilis]